MARGTAADNSVTPVVLNRLFETAARIEESSLQARHKNVSIQLAFFVYFLGYLGFRLGMLLHFDEKNVIRNVDGTIVGIEVPTHEPCNRSDGERICRYCRNLAKARARNADDPDAVAEDFYDEYWSPKSNAGNRKIPVRQERGRDIIERYLQIECQVDESEETVRRRLTFLAEMTDDVDPDQLMPQALRASAANYWINLAGFDVKSLKTLMGWKYLTTAQFYVTGGFQQLWHKMGLALGKEPKTAFDVDLEPPTYDEIRSNSTLMRVETLTPESEVSRHVYEYDPNPLEKEANENHQTKMSSFGDSSSVKVSLEPITPKLLARLRYEYESLETSLPLWRLVAAGASAIGVAAFFGVLFATNGYLEELFARETQAIATFVAAVTIALPWMIYDIHETHHRDPQAVEAKTQFDRLILWIHARVDPIVSRYCLVERRVLSPFASIQRRIGRVIKKTLVE